MSDDERGPRSNMVTIDTSRIEDVIQDFELIFDTAKPGRYDDPAKLASLSTMTDCPLLKELIRGWVKNGTPIGQGRKVAWRLAKWYGGADALRKYFPPGDSRDQAADDLADFKQRQRADLCLLCVSPELGDQLCLSFGWPLDSNALCNW